MAADQVQQGVTVRGVRTQSGAQGSTLRRVLLAVWAAQNQGYKLTRRIYFEGRAPR